MNSCEEIMKIYSWEEKTVEEYVVDMLEEALDIVGLIGEIQNTIIQNLLIVWVLTAIGPSGFR